jgi:MarR-like DNA-binding transcriptional regulator SgrR of sgrS sRNA
VYRSIATSGLLLCAAVAAAGTRPHYGGTLHMETAASADAVARPLVFDTLTRTAPNGEAAPSLATRWAVENESQRWQFWLRSGVHFHDGSDLTADDVVRSLSAECASACPWKTLRAVGGSVVFTTESPAPTLPQELACSNYIVSRKTSDGQLDGSGPFQIASRGKGSLLLTAVDDAWQGRPFLDSIEIEGQRDQRAQLLDLSVGRADLIDIAPEAVRQAQQSHLTLLTSQPTALLALVIHSNAMQTPAQREAVADAVDRSTLWSVIFQKQGEASASLLPNSLTGYTFLFSPDRNLSRATELAAAVHAPLTLAAQPGDPVLQLVAERLALNLHEAGLNVQVRSANPDAADLVLRRIPLEAAAPRPALHQMLQQLGHDAEDGSGDPASLYRVERTFLAEHAVIPLLWLPRTYGAGVRVHGLKLAPDGTPLLADVSLKTAP